MKECVQCLLDNGYKLIEYDDTIHVRFRKFIDGNDFVLLLIGPHKGNNFGYILRGDFVETHDKWSNADYQRFFRDKDDFLKNWNRFWLFDVD